MSAFLLAAALAGTQINCAEAVVQADLNECALVEFNTADAALKSQWKTTLRIFAERSSEDTVRLRAAQRAWIAYRDAECDARHPFDLGVSLDKMLNINCRTTLTIERTETLAELSKDF